jgi:hypothetical protein
VIHGLADILTDLRFGKHFALPVIGRDACVIAFQRGRKFFGFGLVLGETGNAPGAKKAYSDEKITVHLNALKQYYRFAGLAPAQISHLDIPAKYFAVMGAKVTHGSLPLM